MRVPYFLEPQYDEQKEYIETNRERLITKWGGKEGWERQKLSHDLKGRGLEAGIPHFNLDRKASNTMASHRLIQYIGKRYGLAVSEAIYDLLNVYYFVDGHSLNDRPLLASVVAKELENHLDSPPTQSALLEFLNGNEGRREIEEAVETLQQIGVYGIPKFIIEGQKVVDGAARSEVFVSIFREIEERGYCERPPLFGEILGVSNEVLSRGSHLPVDDVAV